MKNHIQSLLDGACFTLLTSIPLRIVRDIFGMPKLTEETPFAQFLKLAFCETPSVNNSVHRTNRRIVVEGSVWSGYMMVFMLVGVCVPVHTRIHQHPRAATLGFVQSVDLSAFLIGWRRCMMRASSWPPSRKVFLFRNCRFSEISAASLPNT